jgi:hypothetical protein
MTSDRQMRTKFSLTVVVTLLFCGLTPLEFPELLSLTDDTSNDFTLVVSTNTASHVAKDQTPKPAPEIVRPSKERFEVITRSPLHDAPHSSHSSSDYLDFLCVHRT